MSDEIIINIFDDLVQSVNGQTGDVFLDVSDNILYSPTVSLTGHLIVSNNVSISGTLETSNPILSSGVDLYEIFSTTDKDQQTLSFDDSSQQLSISNGNTISLSSINSDFASNSSRYDSVYNNVNSLSSNWNTAYDNVSSQDLNINSEVRFKKVSLDTLGNVYFTSPENGRIAMTLVGTERVRFNPNNDAIQLMSNGTALSFGPLNTTGAAITRDNLGLGTAAQAASGVFALSSLYQNLTANWQSVYNNVNALSSSWEESADIIPTVTNYLSTNNVSISSIDVMDRVVLDNQLYYVANEDGQWLGRTKIKENNARLNNISKNWNFIPSLPSNPSSATGVAMTSDGRSQIFVGQNKTVYQSDDYGKTFSVGLGVIYVWSGVAMSSDGKYRTLVTFNGPIYRSNNYGSSDSWVVITTTITWSDVAMSSDGKYQTATANNNGQIYISSDYGNTWTPKGINGEWVSVAMSSDGKYQTATQSPGFVFKSNDYGNTWVNAGFNDGNPLNYSGVAISSDGRYQAIAQYNGIIIVSKDYGNNWNTIAAGTNVSRNWKSVAMSGDGKYMTAVAENFAISYSGDHGISWSSDTGTLSQVWTCVAMSSDGKYQIAGGNNSTVRSVADDEMEGNFNVIGDVGYIQPYVRATINGTLKLGPMLNSVEYIIPWNVQESSSPAIIDGSFVLTNDNFIIKKTGTYHVKVRFSCYDMQDATDYLRLRLRQSTSGFIGNASAGSFVTTLGWRFMGGFLLGNGEAYVDGETILRVTGTVPVYLVATVLGAGGSGNGNTTFYPYIDNAFGTQPYMEVRKIA